MKIRLMLLMLAIVALLLLRTPSVFAQSVPSQESKGQESKSADDGKRKVKTRVVPAYPELARRINVSGKVRLEVTITPDGKVKAARTIGGHPLLVQACQDAIKSWRFMPASEESTQVVEFDFTGASN